MTRQDYLTDWSTFIEHIGMLIHNGVSDSEISKKLRDKQVIWEGCIAEIKLYEDHSPGVALSMNPERKALSNGKILRTDHLFLNISEGAVSEWAGCKVGDIVRFKATIVKSNSPFLEIQLSECDDDPEILLMIGLYDCHFIC